MIKKKLCMLGAAGVGKTSLVARFVLNLYSDKYLTTVGVKISKKSVVIDRVACDLMVWDLAGEDEFVSVQMSALRHTDGYLLVADGTRRGTLDVAVTLQNEATAVAGDVPFLLLLNKADLADAWEITDADVQVLAARGWQVIRTSAKTGNAVEEAFVSLAKQMLSPR